MSSKKNSNCKTPNTGHKLILDCRSEQCRGLIWAVDDLKGDDYELEIRKMHDDGSESLVPYDSPQDLPGMNAVMAACVGWQVANCREDFE